MKPVRMELVTESGYFAYSHVRQNIVIERDGSTSCSVEYIDSIRPCWPEEKSPRIEPIDAGEILDAVDRLIMNNPKIDEMMALDTGIWNLTMVYDDGSRRSKQGLAIIDEVKGLRISTAIRHSLLRSDLIVFGGSGCGPCVILRALRDSSTRRRTRVYPLYGHHPIMNSVRIVLDSCDGKAPDLLTERITVQNDGHIRLSSAKSSIQASVGPAVAEAAMMLILELASRMHREERLPDEVREGCWKLSSYDSSDTVEEYSGSLSSGPGCNEASKILRRLFVGPDIIGFGDYVMDGYEHVVYPYYDPARGWMCGRGSISEELAEAMSGLLDIPFCRAGSLDGDSSDFLLDTTIAGTCYVEDIDDILPQISKGDVLMLKRDPGNTHDSHAVKVFAESGHRIGYIPRKCNETVANLMDQGHEIYAIVQEVDPTQRSVYALVYMRNRGYLAIRHFSDASSPEYGVGTVMDALPVTRESFGFVDFGEDPVHFTYDIHFG